MKYLAGFLLVLGLLGSSAPWFAQGRPTRTLAAPVGDIDSELAFQPDPVPADAFDSAAEGAICRMNSGPFGHSMAVVHSMPANIVSARTYAHRVAAGYRDPLRPELGFFAPDELTLSVRYYLPGLLSRSLGFPEAFAVPAPSPIPPTDLPPVPTAPPATSAPPIPTVPPTPHLPPSPTPGALVTYYRDAKPILDAHCIGCHLADGIAPFPLDAYAPARQNAYPIAGAMEARTMPPLPALADSCTPFNDSRVMTQAERETLVDWVTGGAVAGDPETAPKVVPPSDPLGPPSDHFDIGVNYEPGKAKGLDNYHCFVIDPGFKTDVSLRMSDIQPSNSKLYHHGILFLALPSMVGTIDKLDAAEAGPGYSCFGGPGIPSTDWLVGEAPGAMPAPYPDESAMQIPAGSKFVLQIHYNFLNGHEGTDRSQVNLWRAKKPAKSEPRNLFLANGSFRIPPGEAAYTATATSLITRAGTPSRSPFDQPEGNIWGAVGHMHLLGQSVKIDLLRANGSEECLLDIPAWDFNWQGTYNFKQPVKAKAGDRVRITCVWDNSEANQPFVDGERQEPRTVSWGEGTLDEMCLGGVTLVDP